MGQSVGAFLAKPAASDGPLAPALKLAAGGHGHLVGAVNVSALPIPPQAFDQAPAEVRPLLRAKTVSLGLSLGEPTRFELRATYADDNAKAAEALRRMVLGS